MPGVGACRDRVGVLVVRAPASGRRQLRQTEVEDLHPAVGRDEHVLRLQVAVDDALVVRGREAVGDLHGDVDGLAHGKRPARSRSRSVSPSSNSDTM